MLGADLLERFRRAGLEAAGQRRNVTVLFVDLAGYTPLSERIDSEELYEVIQQFLNLLADDVYKYDGMVDKFTGDGLMALFGAPIGHENNAELAVRAALDMQADVAALSQQLNERLGTELRVHVGLHSGIVVVGGIGSDMLMNYTAIGDTVNLAQRLEDASAPGVILASDAVYQQTRVLFDFDPEPTLHLKGFQRPVKAYRAIGAKARPGLVRGIEGLQAPMIGRDSELTRLKTVVENLTELKAGSFALITGEAGIGKSRLVRELKGWCSSNQVTVVEGQSLTYRRSVAYWIFVDTLRNYLGVGAGASDLQVRERLVGWASEMLQQRAGEILPYLEHMLSLPPSDPASAERIRYLDASQLRQQIFLAVRRLLTAEARRKPFLLILEDLHWADETSLDLLQFLLESARHAPLSIIAISRPIREGIMVKVIEWAAEHLGENYYNIPLRGLSFEQSEQLLSQLLATPDLPVVLHEGIVERAGGVPFYLEELLRVLIDQNILQREAGQWRLVPGVDIGNLGVPQTLEGLILARFDRLESFQRRVLQVASAVGRQFGIPVLRGVLCTLPQEQLDQALAGLVQRDFILPEDASPGDYYFRHVLMSDAIYKTLLKREQRDLHGQIGVAIETVYAERLESQIEILARHYTWSDRHDRALHYLILAGQKASRNYANELARQHFEQALVLLSQVEHSTVQTMQVEMGLGDVLTFAGEYSPARRHYQTALDTIVNQDGDASAREIGLLKRKTGTTYERQGDYDDALAWLAQAQQVFTNAPTPMPVEQAEILHDIGWIHNRRGNVDEAERNLLQALALAESSSRYDVVASIYNRLAGVYYQKDQLDQASNFLRKSLVLREEIGDTVAVARSYSNLGLLTWRKGDWDQALSYFKRGAELQATLGDVEGNIQLQANIGLLLTDKGDLEEARHYLEESLQSALKIGHGFMEGIACHHLSRMWLAAGEWQKSLDYSNRAFGVFTEMRSDENLIELYASLGEAWLGLGDVDQARRSGANAMELLRKREENPTAPPLEQGRVLRLLGNVALAQSDLIEAARLFKESAAHFTSLGNQLELGRTLAAMALLDQARGDRTSSRLHLNEARLIFGQLGAKLDLQKVEQMM
jgi:adenylate cyclase